ncbi:pyruvate dehydrogenase (acetyl-transferring) E1 component subunit alpha [Georgenia thermotolerans]|uniref:Pyruvate dehydrogenase (Acetyl-transferring) E1 component subunit alpha n=1 Tax=Georgenia thermotolerans TaxID=527326 RepID=A0A7J5UKG0_9MICO|nr:pyruvate dehydrogenase (acetyl-transferring) E1 component subunit alpha [Georgenia thermotolerans]KAE8762761.1 pyruvate dehydrogenase (acetyl-transferring) E1 component subunit alpha [Georgenia thermotolerans]
MEQLETMLGSGPRLDDMVQILDADGRRHEDPQYSAYAADLDAGQLRAMYRDMVLTRAFDAEATALQRKGELGLWAPCLGQEAAQVGSAHALAPRDFVFPSYRELGVAQVRGLDLRETLPLFRGVRHGGWDPHAHNLQIPTLVIGAHTLHAVGYAMGVQRDGDVGTGDPTRDRAVVAYFGDGATSQGDTNEALVFAASANAPVVFFCQNNHWAISVPTTTQSRVPLVHRGGGFGIPSVRVDGNDALACYAVAREALERARAGGGPTFIEAVTYRMGAHTTSDDPTRYRDRAEEDLWRAKDPIARLRVYLERQDLADEAFFAEVDDEAGALAESARAYCTSLTGGPVEEMFEHVYTLPHPLVAEEKAAQAAYEAGFADEEDAR